MARRKLTYEARICRNPSCGIEFTPKRKDQIYHTNKCRFDHWSVRRPRLEPRTAPPSRREAELLVMAWTKDKQERSGCILRIWWKDPRTGKVHPQAEAIQIARSR